MSRGAGISSRGGGGGGGPGGGGGSDGREAFAGFTATSGSFFGFGAPPALAPPLPAGAAFAPLLAAGFAGDFAAGAAFPFCDLPFVFANAGTVTLSPVDRMPGSHVDAGMKRSWTLATLIALGGTATADIGAPSAGDLATESISVRSHRGAAEDYLVMPSGGELTAQMRFITADQMLDGGSIKFTDLALFGLSARWSLFSRLELGVSVDLLPKQPAGTDEKPWQSVGGQLRSPLGKHVAIQIAGGGGHLMNHSGKWTSESLTLEWKKPIAEVLAFDVQGGIVGLGLDAPNTPSNAFITEVSINTTAMFREPKGHWGGWLGIGYSVPVQASGRDPTTDLAIDPQPRLNFHAGTVVSLVKKWDLYIDIAVVDRGDRASPTTQLPILNGGFDQQQIIFGITRHIESKPSAPPSYDHNDGMYLGAL